MPFAAVHDAGRTSGHQMAAAEYRLPEANRTWQSRQTCHTLEYGVLLGERWNPVPLPPPLPNELISVRAAGLLVRRLLARFR